MRQLRGPLRDRFKFGECADSGKPSPLVRCADIVPVVGDSLLSPAEDLGFCIWARV